MKNEIEFDSEELEAAEHWHGGQSSMLYAIVSTGSLKRNPLERCRPWIEDGNQDRPMTDDEWMRMLVENLQGEAEDSIASARKQLKGTRGQDRQDLLADIEGLESIVARCGGAL